MQFLESEKHVEQRWGSIWVVVGPAFVVLYKYPTNGIIPFDAGKPDVRFSSFQLDRTLISCCCLVNYTCLLNYFLEELYLDTESYVFDCLKFFCLCKI